MYIAIIWKSKDEAMNYHLRDQDMKMLSGLEILIFCWTLLSFCLAEFDFKPFSWYTVPCLEEF